MKNQLEYTGKKRYDEIIKKYNFEVNAEINLTPQEPLEVYPF